MSYRSSYRSPSPRPAGVRILPLAFLLLAVLAARPAGADDACAASGQHGGWGFACKGATCTLQPLSVSLMDRAGTRQEASFGFRLEIDPPSHITVDAPPGATADLLQVSATGGVIVEAKADGKGRFTITQRDKLMTVVDALQGGKRLLLVFVDSSLAVNTAVVAVGHDGFAAALAAAFQAADAAKGGRACTS